MRALFITTKTADCENHVRAWESVYGTADLFQFDHKGIRNDWMIIDAVRSAAPDIVFYIGAAVSPANPRIPTLATIKEMTTSVCICSDAGDTPWNPTLRSYRKHQSFDLVVAIDGSDNSLVDYVTLTPVNHRAFGRHLSGKDIRCGFSGSVGKWNPRAEMINAVRMFGELEVRPRGGDYSDHVNFMKRCQIILNVSNTGSGLSHHIKGRVLEAGFANCALLESAGSPISRWFPPECYIIYEDAADAVRKIRELPDTAVNAAADALFKYVRDHYTARQIYSGILERLDNVGSTKQRAS